MKMKFTTSLAIITALVMHLSLLMVTSVANHTTMSNSSSVGFSFQLFANHEGPYHAIHRESDGFFHFQSKLSSFVTNTTALDSETFHPTYLLYETSVVVGTAGGASLYVLKLDFLSGLTWLQCKPCAPAARQLHALFNPTESPTFRHVGHSDEVCRHHPYELAGERCAFHLSGPRRMSVHGYLARDRFFKNSEDHTNFLFGCSHSTENFDSQGRYAGVFGTGRMPGSLVMQAAAKGLTQFSYCLFGGSKTKRQGLLSFGTDMIPQNPNSRTIRILPALDTHESEYYLSLVGISLGANKLGKIRPEMFARRMNGHGGCVIDPGTPLSVMAEKPYRIVEEAIWSDLQHHHAERVNRQGFGLCVRATEAIMAHLQSMSLHFSEENAALVLSPKQLFLIMHEKPGRIACLAMKPGQRTVIGAFQQVDMRFIYDLNDSKLYFAPESCIQDTVEVV